MASRAVSVSLPKPKAVAVSLPKPTAPTATSSKAAGKASPATKPAAAGYKPPAAASPAPASVAKTSPSPAKAATEVVPPSGAAIAFADSVIGEPFTVILSRLGTAFEDKAAAMREGGLVAFARLCGGDVRRFEPYLVNLLPKVFDLLADKDKAVRAAADTAAKAFHAVHCPLKILLPIVLAACDAYKAPTKQGALDLLNTMAKRAPLPMCGWLKDIVPALTNVMADTKPQTVATATEVMLQVCSVIDNDEVRPFVPTLVSCMARPQEAAACVNALANRTFVQCMDTPVLSIFVPVLIRGLTECKSDTKRQVCMIVDAMSKLVDDPNDAHVFLPRLLPGLRKAMVEISDPDGRARAALVVETLLTIDEAASHKVYEDPGAKATAAALAALREHAPADGGIDEATFSYLGEVMGELITSLSHGAEFDEYKKRASAAVGPLVDLEAEDLDKFISDIVNTLLSQGVGAVPPDEHPEYSIYLPNLVLAFGQRILLHEAPLTMLRGRRYALFGRNGVGKTTLMSRMGAGDIRGFPTHLKCVYVKHEILTSPGVTVEQFMTETAAELNAPVERAQRALREVGFSEAGVLQPVSELSGGWRMKLALARSKLQRMDILLLDEPTNHLDDGSIRWLVEYLNSLGDTTVVVVSHDVGFLEATITDVVWMHDLQLTYYNESFKTFMGKRKEYAAAAKADRIARGKTRLNEDEVDVEMEFDERAKPFKMPTPGALDGIKTRGETVLRMREVTFKYPGCERPTLTNVTVRMNMMSRVAIMGENGAGKSTLLRNLVGELEPEAGCGEVTKHHNLRVAFIAQHSMHHLEKHKESTPLEYIAKRYKLDRDEEQQEKLTVKLTEEEEQLRRKPDKIFKVFARRQKFGGLEYECKLNDGKEEMKWLGLSFLKTREPYVMKLVRAFDEAQNAESAGLGVISRTQKKIAEYLQGFGLSGEDVMNKVNQLSGGQRSRLVLGAAMWTRPHVLCLDEPTNYLDIEAMDSLAEAIKLFKGAVLLVSHNERFVTELVNEWWHVKDGTVTVIKKTKEGGLPEAIKKAVDDEAAKKAYLDGTDVEEGGDEPLGEDPPPSLPASAMPSPTSSPAPSRPTSRGPSRAGSRAPSPTPSPAKGKASA